MHKIDWRRAAAIVALLDMVFSSVAIFLLFGFTIKYNLAKEVNQKDHDSESAYAARLWTTFMTGAVAAHALEFAIAVLLFKGTRKDVNLNDALRWTRIWLITCFILLIASVLPCLESHRYETLIIWSLFRVSGIIVVSKYILQIKTILAAVVVKVKPALTVPSIVVSS